MVAHNTERKGKWLWTEDAGGEPIGLFEAADGEQEALFIADAIQQMLRERPGRPGSPSSTAPTRSRGSSRRRCGATDVDYHVVGGFSFYQRAEIRDALAYLKVAGLAGRLGEPAAHHQHAGARHRPHHAGADRAATPASTASAAWDGHRAHARGEAVPGARRGGAGGFPQDDRGVEGSGRPRAGRTPFCGSILDRTGYRRMLEADDSPDAESRLENLDELMNAAAEAAERGEGIAEFLDHAALVSDADQLDERAQVSLLTLHNAKGLEFPVVFIAGLEEGLFPHSRSLDPKRCWKRSAGCATSA